MRGVLVLSGLAIFAACFQSGPSCPGTKSLLRRCFGHPQYVAYRDGDGPWQTPAIEKDGMADLCVTDDYETVVVDASGSAFDAYEVASTISESTSATQCSPSGASTGSGASTVEVTGQMMQRGTVWMGDQGEEVLQPQEPWTYTLPVVPGVHDLVATSDGQAGDKGGSLLIRRRQSISAPTTEPLIDLTVDGVPLEPVPLSIQGAISGETLTAWLSLTSGTGDSATISQRQDGILDAIPAALLEKTDQQWVEVDGDRHGMGVTFTGSETSFTLLPPLDGITMTATPAPAASWATIAVDGYTWAQLFVMNGAKACFGCSQRVIASRGWLDSHGVTSLTFDTSAPGYQSSWIIDGSMPFSAGFSVSIDTDTTSTWTGAPLLQPSGAALTGHYMSPPRGVRLGLGLGARVVRGRLFN